MAALVTQCELCPHSVLGNSIDGRVVQDGVEERKTTDQSLSMSASKGLVRMLPGLERG